MTTESDSDANGAQPVDLRQAALDLAESGQAVFPCHWTGEDAKRPLTPHGFKDATTDRRTVAEWWATHPDAAIGTPTGGSWPTVLDLDRHDDGYAEVALAALTRAGLLRGCHRIVRTPRGGLHLYFSGSPQPSRSVQRLHIDLKGVGGYVLAPPSRITSNESPAAYVELAVREPRGQLDWATCQKVLATLTPHKETHGLAQVVASAAEGQRNDTVFWAASRAVEDGQDLGAIRQAAIESGLGPAEVDRTLNSAASRSRR